MILRLTPKTAAPVGETAEEWELLEKQVRAGRWTTGERADEGRLRQLAGDLGVPVAGGGRGADAAAHPAAPGCLT
jgi:hypothetical protein